MNSEHLTDTSSSESELFSHSLENERVPEFQHLKATSNRKVALSFGQQRLWYMEQLNPGSALYNIRFTLHLKGELYIDALRNSLQAIIRRHEILRTTFEDPEGTPRQVIHAEPLLQLPIDDLRAFPLSERQQQAEELMQQAAQQPFDLSKLPLLRALLVRLEDKKWLLSFTFHHCIFDGWSLRIFFKELSHCYQAYLKAEEPTLAPPPMQYADYAIWQHKQEQEGIYASQRTYWQKQLQGAPTLLDLPKDYPRPAVSNFIGEKLPIRVDLLQTERLRALARKEGCSLYMVVLAIWLTLLYRYSGQEEMVVGTLIANRTNAETEQLIGFLANTLALRIFLGDDPIFRELLKRVREVALDAYEHQDLPFDQIVSLAHPSREINYMPLVQVMFAFQNASSLQVHLPGLEAEYERNWTETAKFDLTLDLTEDSRGLHGVLEYSTELFAQERMQRMIGHLDTLFSVVTGTPQERLSDLPLLTEAEKHRQIRMWNQTQVDFPTDQCFPQLFESQVQRTPEAMAVACEQEHFSYQQLNERANQLAHYLRQLGVGPEVLVGVYMERSLDLVVALLGILKAGGAYVPLDTAYPQERLTFLLEDAQVPILLTHASLHEHLPMLQAQVLCLDTAWPLIARANRANPTSGVQPHHLAYVIYTSGSTGQPKGVLVQHQGLVNLINWHVGTFAVSAQDHATQFATMSFDAAGWELWPYLTVGACVHFVPDGIRTDPIQLQDWLVAQSITMCFLPTTLAEHMLTLQWPVSLALRMLLVGGDVLHHYPSPSLPFKLINNYGPTESTVVATSCQVASGDQSVLPTIGRPIANTHVYILDQYLQPAPIGVPGELHIGGVGLARGYLNRPELTAEKFIAHPFRSEPGARLYKTGDLARYLPDGSIEFLGRLDHQVKLRGFRIEPGEIEAVLNQHPAIQEAVVLLREDTPGDKRLVAYLIFTLKQQITGDDLRRYLQGRLPHYMVPGHFVMLPQWPLTPNGKLDRRALPAPQVSRPDLEVRYIAPRTSIEELLTAIWNQVLKMERIGIYDNFFDLGGDSLLVSQVVARVRQAIQIELSLSSFFATPTIAAQAEQVMIAQQAEQRTKVLPLWPRARANDMPLSFEQEGLWIRD